MFELVLHRERVMSAIPVTLNCSMHWVYVFQDPQTWCHYSGQSQSLNPEKGENMTRLEWIHIHVHVTKYLIMVIINIPNLEYLIST